MISIIIPAHNEERVIRRCLEALVPSSDPGDLEIIVVCNGCRDKTAEIARTVPGPIRVIETEIPSKTHALNIGDANASHFPRFYIDSDLVFPIHDLRLVQEVLEQGPFLAAAPQFLFDDSGASKTVKAYYAVWKTMPYFETGRIAGAYGLSEEGRSRFEDFPNVVADDGYVRLQFAPGERTTVKEAIVRVTTPRTTKDLIRIKTRSRRGTDELKRRYPSLFQNETAAPGKSFRRLFVSGISLSHALAYVYVNLSAKVMSVMKRISRSEGWERDESSRG